MASKIRDLIARFRRPEAGSDELAATLEDARAVLAATEAAMTEADQAYSSGLLEHDAEQLQAFRAQRDAAAVERDRAIALVSSLEARLVQTRDAEAEAALQAEIASVNAEADRVADKIRARYPALARELVGLLKEISAADRKVSAMNERLARMGRPVNFMDDVQARGLPRPESTQHMAHSIWGHTHLVEMGEFAPGWEVTALNYREL